MTNCNTGIILKIQFLPIFISKIKWWIFILVALFFCSITFSQAQFIRDKYYEAPEKTWKLMFVFDGRRSLIASQNVKIGGIRTGMQFKNLFRSGIGFYGFAAPLRKEIIFPPNARIKRAEETLNYSYATLFFEPILYRYRKWEFSVPMALGAGKARLALTDTSGVLLKFKEGGAGFFEIAAYAEYRFFWWIGIGGGTGFRKILNTDIIEGNKLNGPYYQLAVKIYFGEIAKRIFTKKKKGKKSAKP